MNRKLGFASGVAALALAGAMGAVIAGSFASAQDRPESLLPPGFDDPAPTPTPSPVPAPTARPTVAPAAPASAAGPAGPGAQSIETVQPLPQANIPSVPQISDSELARLPSLEELEDLSTDELDDLLGLKPQYDIPPAARRSMSQVGLLSPEEGGLPTRALARQPAALVRAILAGTDGPLVSRWGHILLRRALASRLVAPNGMDPIEFASLRAGVLNSMGEFYVARGLVQDVDTGNWNAEITAEALDAYVATFDLVGACPAVRLRGSALEGPRWMMMQAICNAYAGEGALAASQLNAARSEEIAPQIDILLAQRYAGAAGRGRRGVNIEWEGVEELTPWRFAIANAVGEPIPETLLGDTEDGPRAGYFSLVAASAPMLPLSDRARHAEIAAARGVFSSSAMVDFYSQIYANNTIGGEAGQRAARLRDAYVGTDPADRIAAMRGFWGAGDLGFAGQVTTAYAAARVTPSSDFSNEAGELIASMLTAGLDRDAAAWSEVIEPGSLAWALVATGTPGTDATGDDALDRFVDNDDSERARKSAFLVAGLAGLGRVNEGVLRSYGDRLDIDFTRQNRWTRMIDRAAEVRNPALVALLAGLGMQGNDWSQMTPLHLYYLVSALRRVGLEPEARMIAAEAVARG